MIMKIVVKKFQTMQDFAAIVELKFKKKTNNIVREEKNMILALFLSIFLAGLGLVYAGDKKELFFSLPY